MAEPYAALLAVQLVKRYSVLKDVQGSRGGIPPRPAVGEAVSIVASIELGLDTLGADS